MLRKTIGRKTLLLLTINTILGTGIFFLPAVGALAAGPASILAWIAMSVVAVAISFYFAELVSMYPKSGGVYEFVKHAFGEFPAFIIGWSSWLIANITIAMLVVGSLNYLLPASELSGVLAVAIVLFFNAISYRGMNISAKMLLFFGATTVVVLLALIIPGLPSVAENAAVFSTPAMPAALMLALYLIAETFFGWETTTYLAEEVKNARKLMPRVIVLSTVLIAVISILLVAVSMTAAPWSAFAESAAPLAFLASNLFGAEAGALFGALIFIPLVGTAASWIVSSPRLLYAMSRDKILTKRFSRLTDHGTPGNAIIFQTIVTVFILFVAFADYLALLTLLVPMVIIVYSVVMLCVVALREKRPKARRFAAPLWRDGPVAIVLFNAFLLVTWLNEPGALETFAMGLMLILLGIPLYIIIKLSTDRLFVEKFFNRISPLWERMFSMFYSQEDARRLVKKLRLRRDSVVLDFGAGTGITTRAIAERASEGTVVAVDISERQLERAIKSIEERDMHNVLFVKKGEIDFGRNSFDAVAAVGVLEYNEEPERIVRDLLSMLKKDGRFAFLSFGSSLGLPAPRFLKSEESVRRLFPENAKVHVEKERRKGTDYWYMWGSV